MWSVCLCNTNCTNTLTQKDGKIIFHLKLYSIWILYYYHLHYMLLTVSHRIHKHLYVHVHVQMEKLHNNKIYWIWKFNLCGIRVANGHMCGMSKWIYSHFSVLDVQYLSYNGQILVLFWMDRENDQNWFTFKYFLALLTY